MARTALRPSARPAPSVGVGFLVGVATVDWLVEQISAGEQDLLGVPAADVVGRSLLELVHRGDVEALHLAAKRAAADLLATTVVVDLGGPARWSRASVVVTPMVGGDERVGFAVHRVGRDDAPVRAMQLEQHLQRIARELEAAHISLGALDRGPDIEAMLGPDALSPRQWDILRRLLQGERVPGIAKALYLSPSTVRNHLTAIFAKFGVHSQEELIQLLRADVNPAISLS